MSRKEIRRHNQADLNELQEGDMIEFDRAWGVYSHWAVYIGESRVIHLAGDPDAGISANLHSGSVFTICGQTFSKAFVKNDDLWEVARQSTVYKNNSKDRTLDPKRPAQIVSDALAKVGSIGYNVLWSNCEHFATYCRYDVEQSDQRNMLKIGDLLIQKAREAGLIQDMSPVGFFGWVAAGLWTVLAAVAGIAVVVLGRKKK